MSDLALALILIFGAPLTLLALGFLLIALRIFLRGDEKRRLSEAAGRLEETLSGLEVRVSALEDIIDRRL